MSQEDTASTDEQAQDHALRRLVLDQGLATESEVDACLKKVDTAEQANLSRAGEAMVEQGVITRGQLERLKPQLEENKTAQQIPGYRILKKLGAGAMATVYLGRQISLDRLVAIKVLPRKFSHNQEFVERFYAEGRAAAKLNNPHIVGALDVGQAGEYHYFVMEYVEGRTVYDDIQEHRRLSEKEALQFMIQIARALDHAHKAGFIHRDVKPKNIMITKEGTAKLADMGLARAVTDREAAEAEKGRAYGTPYYISPEQIRGEVDVDFRADIYSLGATFYHLVTGQVPFEGPNPSAVMHKHLKEELVPPDHLNPDLSAGIGEIIEVCMAKDRNQRYNSTSDLLQDFEAVARGEAPLQARRKFDLSSLAQIEIASEERPAAAPNSAPGGPHAEASPLLWIAVSGWGVAALLLVGLVLALVL